MELAPQFEEVFLREFCKIESEVKETSHLPIAQDGNQQTQDKTKSKADSPAGEFTRQIEEDIEFTRKEDIEFIRKIEYAGLIILPNLFEKFKDILTEIIKESDQLKNFTNYNIINEQNKKFEYSTLNFSKMLLMYENADENFKIYE